MEERIDFLVDEKPRSSGVAFAVTVSLAIHTLLIIYVIHAYHPSASRQLATPIVRYVELMRQNPRQFTEAPGKKVATAPLNAPFSDANRKASMPTPTGPEKTVTPGEGNRVFTPPPQRSTGDNRQPSPSAPAIQQSPAAPQPPAGAAPAEEPNNNSASSLAFRKPQPQAVPANAADWRNAIRQAAQSGSGGSGPRGMDLNGAGGGEKGFAESGPLSFETQWYDWGDYAESMVSRIRVNWYANMPDLIKTGMKGVVTIRFTIHRDGHLTDIVILNSSGIPPYDAGAKHAIELSSPLRPLPKDFPNETERVTCMFYYNMELPKDR